MKIILIHGAGASNISWNWVGSQIGPHVRVHWDLVTDPEENLKIFEKELTEQSIIIGHSMGGLYAWQLANAHPELVVHGVSISTPWGGSMQASFWKMFNVRSPWLRMLSRTDQWTASPRYVETTIPWTNVVTTRGFDLFGLGTNDGVVTVASQRELLGPSKEIVMSYGHNEILQSTELVEIINNLIASFVAK